MGIFRAVVREVLSALWEDVEEAWTASFEGEVSIPRSLYLLVLPTANMLADTQARCCDDVQGH
jgi:hypothetical protein